MSTVDRADPASDDSLETRPRCVALVPVIPSAQWSNGPGRRWPPNSIFVTQLIATSEPAPLQTQSSQRTAIADARSAYKARQSLGRGPGSQTRQII